MDTVDEQKAHRHRLEVAAVGGDDVGVADGLGQRGLHEHALAGGHAAGGHGVAREDERFDGHRQALRGSMQYV